jgi:hypothetical protein
MIGGTNVFHDVPDSIHQKMEELEKRDAIDRVDGTAMAAQTIAAAGVGDVISRQADLQPMLDAALADRRVDALVVPIGTGELVCRKR